MIYNVGDKLLNIQTNCLCTLIKKIKNGYFYDYILRDDKGDEFIIDFKRILDHDFRKTEE